MTTKRPRRRLIPIGAALCMAACAVTVESSGVDFRVQATPMRLAEPRFHHVGELQIEEILILSGRGFGGLSGLSVAPKGDSFVAVSDIGFIVRGQLLRDSNGGMLGVANVKKQNLWPTDKPLVGKTENDAEELTPAPGGGWLVSFERHHRILRFGPNFGEDGAAAMVAEPPGLRDAPENGGVEALTMWPDGAVLALREAADADGTVPAWFALSLPEKSADWRSFRYRPENAFSPSGAAALPNGDVLILERRVTLLSGFSVRLVLLRRADILKGGVTTGRELGRLEPPWPSDNFEGASVVPRSEGGYDVYLISDDNFNPLQSTLLIRLFWPASL